MIKTLVLLFSGFEEIEALAPVDLLRRAGAQVVTAAVGPSLSVRGRSGVEIKADVLFDEVKTSDFDAAVLPGGPGTDALLSNSDVIEFFSRHNKNGKLVAGICAAPVVLKAAGALKDKKCTAHTSRVSELENCTETEPVVRDANLITSRGAGTALEFGLALVEYFFCHEKAKKVACSICFMK